MSTTYTKPPSWNLSPGLTDPKYGWFWEGMRVFFPYFDGSGSSIGNSHDIFSDLQGVPAGGDGWTITQWGRAHDSESGDDGNFAAPEHPSWNFAGEGRTVFMLASPDFDSSSTAVLRWSSFGENNVNGMRCFYVGSVAAGSWRWKFSINTSTLNLDVSSTVFAAGDLLFAAAQWNRPNAKAWIFNITSGKMYTNTGTIDAAIATTSGDVLQIGNDQDAGASWPGKILYFGISGGTHWTDRSLRSLARDPFAPIRPDDQIIAKVAAVGGLGIPIAAYHYEHHLRG